MKYIMIPALCLLTGAASANECKYTTDVDTSFEGVISKSQNYDRKTYPYINDTRKCVVSMDVKINNKWHPTAGTYIFGPNMAENAACKNAELVAKESILRTTVPEKLKKKMEQHCKVSVGEKPKAPPVPKAVPRAPVTISKLPLPRPTSRVPLYRPGVPAVIGNPIFNGGINGGVVAVTPNGEPILPDILPFCRRIWMTVWIDGQEQLAWKEVCR